MWIVKYADGTRHSAWASKYEARDQVLALIEHGYLVDRHVEYDETVSCENGHYYV